MQDNNGRLPVVEPCGCRADSDTGPVGPGIADPQFQLAQGVNQIPPARKGIGGDKGYCLRLDSAMSNDLKETARRYGVTQRAVIEEALRFYLSADAAARTDEQLAPIINRVVQDQHQVLGKGLRTLIVRIGHEIMRTQFVLLNFMAAAGIPESKVDKWHSDGWRYAVREFKQRPTEEPPPEA